MHKESQTPKGADVGRGLGIPMGPSQIGGLPFFLLCLAVIAQLTTLWITWDAWQVRDALATIPNLPWFGNPTQIDFGWMLVASLIVVMLSPRRYGFWIHVVILSIAICSDQLRFQPQIFSVTVLMGACIFPASRKISVWFLIAMWLWAGLHKLASPDWTGEYSYHMLQLVPLGGEKLKDYHFFFAIFVAATEIGLSLLAWRHPRKAAPVCLIVHLGIVAFLIIVKWNFSVLPWNLCTAVVGAWLLWTAGDRGPLRMPTSKRGRVLVAMLLVTPIGFYFGLLRHSAAHVLYSGNVPNAIITHKDGAEICAAIFDLQVPLPHEQKAYIDLFKRKGEPGEKLHIREYRGWLKSHYFVMSKTGAVNEITREEFFSTTHDTVMGIAHDDRRKRHQLAQHFEFANRDLDADDMNMGALQIRDAESMVWAIKFNPSKFEPSLSSQIDGLPNLELIDLRGCNIKDANLKHFTTLFRLEGIDLASTGVTNAGLVYFKDLPRLKVILHEESEITADAATAITDKQ